ncbi:MAG: hypothetical protein AAFY60_17930, partial [Myxococcota bacterium]
IETRGALRRRISALRLLAAGEGFSEMVGQRMGEEPRQLLRFLKTYILRVEREDATVRSGQRPNLEAVRAQLLPFTSEGPKSTRAATERVLERFSAVLRGEGALEERISSPLSEVFVGTVRVAPSDTPPWPFRTPNARPPRAIRPLKLLPLQRRSADGQWVFGWRLSDT